MFKIFSAIFDCVSPSKKVIDRDVAHQLMENAEARAGRDPHQAEELRSAARAFLSVVR